MNVLIASIGSSKKEKDGRYTYPTTNYQFDNSEDLYTTPYIFDAITKKYGIDQVILVGTTKSDWAGLYHHLLEDKPKDDAFVQMLEDESASQTQSDPQAFRQKLKPLEDALGYLCKEIIILKNGMNKDELDFNFAQCRVIGDLLGFQDDLYFDITHSFRSLPLYQLLIINYLNEILRKEVRIKKITYGMYENRDRVKEVTPVVDLNHLQTLLDYQKAVSEYLRFGTVYTLEEIIASRGIFLPKMIKKVLIDFNDVVNANNVEMFKDIVVKCKNICDDGNINKNKDECRVVLNTIFTDLVNRFYDKLDDDFMLTTALSLWHFEKKRYHAAAVNVCEAIITYASLCLDGRISKGTDRDSIRDKLRNAKSMDSITGGFIKCYNDVRLIRNNLAHALEVEDQKKQIKDLEERIKGIITQYSKFMTTAEYAEELKITLENASAKNTTQNISR